MQKSFYQNLLIVLFVTLQSFTLFFPRIENNKTTNSFISIASLMEKQQLEVVITSKGGYTADCISFELKNLTNDSLKVWIEPGRRLLSEDSTIQDIFIVKSQEIILAANEVRTVLGYGFCCQSTKGGPYKKAVFDVGYIAPDSWQKLADIINENDFPPRAIQSAVWAISNGNSVSSIYAKNQDAIRLLRQTIADIKGEKLPWYSIIYEKDSVLLFSNRPEKIRGKIEYNIKNNGTISIVVRKNGRLVSTLIKGSGAGPGFYNYVMNLDVKGWPKGEYEISVLLDSAQLIKEEKFRI